MGFHRLDPEDEQFVHQHVKPKYDEGCVALLMVAAKGKIQDVKKVAEIIKNR